MSSFDNNAANCNYDKTEFYLENGLASNKKKDRKSHSRKAQDQTDERLKKITETISQLPIKMQKKLEEHVNVLAAVTGKQKTRSITKTFHDRNHTGQSATQKMLCEQYDEQLLDEENVLKELDLDLDLDLNEIKEGPYTLTLDQYESNVSMWKRYGLTKEQYNAHLEYENNLVRLNDFYKDTDHANHPDYRMRLEAAIKKFEDEYDAQVLKEEEEANNNYDWWLEGLEQIYDEGETYEEFLIRTQGEEEEEEEEEEEGDYRETYEEWLENREEDRVLSLREAACDDNRD